MQINLKGEGYCHWRESSGSGENQTTHYYTGKEEYFNVQLVVWSRQNAPDELLPTGTHNFPFRFTIPTDRSLPTSFETSRGSWVEGYIRYTIKAGISSGHPNFDYTSEAQLPVLEIVSVDSPLLRSPVQLERQKSIGVLCCTSGPIIIKIDLPKTGFCVGECVPAVVHIANNSRRDIRMSASIFKIVTYQDTGGYRRQRSDRNRIAQVTQLQPVQPRASGTFNTDQLVIPPSTSPTQASSAVIKIVYLFEVFGDVQWSLGSKQQIPIVIGNVQQSAPTVSAPQPGVPLLGNTAEPNPGNIGFNV